MTTTSTSTAPAKVRRKYTKEYKHEAVTLSYQVGVKRVADDLGINPSMLHDWRRSAKKEGSDAFRGNGNRTELEAELVRLRRENNILLQEREILKKRRNSG